MKKTAAVLVVLFLAVGCASRGPAPVHPPVRKIYVLPVVSPPEVTAENRNFLLQTTGALTAFIQKMDNKAKATQFGERMRDAQVLLGAKMTRALMEALPEAGYEVELIERIPGSSPDAPDDLDYTKISSGPVVHVWFYDVGLYSPMTRIDYIPRINVGVGLIHPLDEDFTYMEFLYYGADSRGEKYWSIPADPRHRFRSFDALLNDPDGVVEAFDAGLQAIARHIGKEFRRAVK
jgi:hypothetical protein